MLCGFARVLGSISTTPLLETQSSRASEAPGRIPCWQGKTQGISPIQPFFAKIRLENICECNGLQTNSLRIGAGNYFARAGNSFRPAGNLREFDPRAPTCPISFGRG